MTSLFPPGRIGRYELVRTLGAGGFGRVYEAVMHGPGGFRLPVALKVLHTGEGLKREARLGGLLRHPHLVDVYEVGEADGTWFCAMEPCPGGTLAAHVPLPPRAVIDVGLAVCDALAYGWEELRLVHLDLKPENLLLRDGVVKVADLGLARARGFEGHAGRIEGTPGFMAPEQRAGRPVDTRADVYALGATLAVLSSGELPDRATTPFEVDDDGDLPSGPDWLRPVLDRCLATDPDDRPADFHELAALLRALPRSGRSLTAHLPPAPRPERGAAALVEAELPILGREGLLAELARALAVPGRVALHGPPGVGKSRLAREAATAWRRATGRPAVLVDLVDATAADGWRHVGHALDAVPTLDGARAALAGLGEALLVLDPIEHLGDLPLDELLGASAGLRLLTVSRRSSPGSVEVPPLDREASIALLRGRASARGARVDERDALEQLAERLGGLPMLLELAAGRIGVLSAAEVLERLGLSLLRTGRVGASAREATLEGALDWSHRLLPADEQRAFAALSVFRGGFTLEAAEEVLAGEGRGTLEVIEGLVDAGLVHHTGAARYRLLAPVAEYASRHLADLEPARRHGAFFARGGTDAAVRATERRGDVRSLVPDLDNLVAATERAVERGDVEVATCALRAAWTVLQRVGPPDLGLRLAERVHAAATEPGHRARTALVAGQACRYRTETLEDALRWYERARAAFALAGDPRGEGLALGNAANIHRDRSRFAEASSLLEQALPRFRAAGDTRSEALALDGLGICAREAGDLLRARARYEDAARVCAAAGEEGVGWLVRGSLAWLLRLEGRPEEALAELDAVARAQAELGDLGNEASAIGRAAQLLAELGRASEAAAAFERAIALFERTGMGWNAEEARRRLRALATVSP